jgi:UPF0755 protein
MTRLRIAALTTLLLLVVTAIGAGWAWQELNAPLELPAEGLIYKVRNGAALSTVTRELHELGVTSHPRLIAWYSRMRGTATRIHAGEYQIEPGLTAITLLDKLNRGEVVLHQFTIVEGWRFREMLGQLRLHPSIAAGGESGAEIMAALGQPDLDPEGQFLPDTYSFPDGTRDIELLRWAHAALQSELDRAWAERLDGGVLANPYHGLILASIIEKETALASERGLISGVMHERLRRGMRLQTDPTVIYGIGDGFDGDLTRADLDRDTPYNTYTRAGLPPTPIALAGVAAIRAAFMPIETGAVYFVATGNPDGSHVFSRTLEEHNAAVSRYLERQRTGP